VIELNTFLSTLPQTPGVYQMLNAQGQTLYVGKARDLKKRVSSYFRNNIPDPKTQVLVQQIVDIAITITETETEALLLESNLIKELKPRYNILLRDDKTYPYLFITTQNTFPRMDLIRGRMSKVGQCFGPYPNASAARASLRLLQKTFLLRQCRDSFFQSRSRPCLQYQIKRCSAPCVGLIDAQHYNQDVKNAILFLEGKESQVMQALTEKMDKAAQQQDYEGAAHYRDQITQMRSMQTDQYITGHSGNDDVIVVLLNQGIACVELLSVRQGHLLGSRSYFPKISTHDTQEAIVMAFIGQHYLAQQEQQAIPKRIIVNIDLSEQVLLEEALSAKAQSRVRLQRTVRGERLRWLQMAQANAQAAVVMRLQSEATLTTRYNALQEDLGLPAQLTRIECFDVSHTQGEATVASCVVFGAMGALKSDYRRFNITNITPGDDYAALQQALMRRYTRVKMNEGVLPDMIIIDGGKGQLHVAKQALEEMQLTDIVLISMGKGPLRKSGTEVIWQATPEGACVREVSVQGRHLLEAIRDEAHRFAIMAHRKKRNAARLNSSLESIPGLGPLRRRALLRHFGGWQEIGAASVKMLATVPGISQALAQRIYESLHPHD
jgi:excinuclease ABC subunit C